MGAPGQDPNKIDVSLSIMSDATLAAVNNLSNQLSGLRELISSQGNTDPGAKAESVGRAAEYVRRQATYTPGTVPDRPPGPPPGPDPPNPSQGAGDSRARSAQLRKEYEDYISALEGGGLPSQGLSISSEAESMMSHRLSDMQRWKVASMEHGRGSLSPRDMGSRMDRFFALYPGTQRDPYEDRTPEAVSGQPLRGGSALPEGISGGGSYPPQGPPTTDPRGDMGDLPGWAKTLQREGITPESRLGLTIPRLGEFTIQDKLNMAAQWMGRSAQRRTITDPDTGEVTYTPGGTTMGRAAAGAAYMRDQSAGIVAVGREFSRLREFARGEELSTEALGYSRESALGDINILGAGMRLNLGFTSAAQREALHQELTQRRIQAAPGISGEEAQRIRQITAGMGYSGGLNENLQMNLFKPLQQRGIAPEGVAPLIDQGVRQGNMSISSLRDTMISLADAARNANMTLEETTSAALEYSESVQQIGANYESSLRNAATFTRTGLDPRLASQAMQSPMMQGLLTMQTGLPPQLQGVIGAPGVMQAMSQAAQQGLALGAPFANMPDRKITTASGETITVATGRDAQIAMAQQMSGLPRQIIERQMRNPHWLQEGGAAQTMVGQMQETVRGLTHRTRTRTINEPVDAFGHPTAVTRAARIAHRQIAEDYNAPLSAADKQRLENGPRGDNVVQYSDLERQMIAMDPKNKEWTDRVRKIRRDHSDMPERLKTAQRIIGEAVNVKPQPDYVVDLSDAAKKYFKIETPKDRTGALPRANAGGAPANAAMQGPNFPGSTGGALLYGQPGP